MKLIIAAALLGFAHAQSLSDIPSCAIPCLDDSVKKNTPCNLDDVKCICQNFSSIQADATGCVLKACGSDTAISKIIISFVRSKKSDY